MSSFKNYPAHLKPKEKALHYGIDSLSDIELLALIINTGYKDKSVLELASDIINSFFGLANLNNITYQSLIKIKGISKHKALLILSIFEINKRINLDNIEKQKLNLKQHLISKYQVIFKNKTRENLYIIYLNNLNKIIKEELLYQGVKNKLVCSPYEIINKVKENGASKFIIIHNHLSLDLKPSDEDIKFTNTLKEESNKNNLILLDHIIINKNSYFSFNE